MNLTQIKAFNRLLAVLLLAPEENPDRRSFKAKRLAEIVLQITLVGEVYDFGVVDEYDKRRLV